MFKKIGVFGKHHRASVSEAVQEIAKTLESLGAQVLLAQESVTTDYGFPVIPLQALISQIDLLVVVGGDGSLLQAARIAAIANKPIVGINRGRLGFLTDIAPQDAKQELAKILAGEFKAEKRTLLESWLTPSGQSEDHYIAFNDIVLFSGDTAQMIEFEVWINGALAFEQRSDGLILATPTGSTAYALSAGGPLLTPEARVFTLVPLCPHMLTSRPLVVDDSSTIQLKIIPSGSHTPRISCDGQLNFSLNPQQSIMARLFSATVTLLHPKQYNYFEVLQEKLGWHTEQKRKT